MDRFYYSNIKMAIRTFKINLNRINKMNNNTKLRLHLWTEEKHKQEAIKLFALKTLVTKNHSLLVDRKELLELSAKILELESETLSLRTPSLSYDEIPKFINNSMDAYVMSGGEISDFICFDNNIYKYLDINCKDLLREGTIRVCINGIEFHIEQTICMAINATDNSTKLRKDIKLKFRKHI